MKIVNENHELVAKNLSTSLLGKHLDLDEIRILVDEAELIEYEAGEAIVLEKHASSDMFIVVRNTVVIEVGEGPEAVYVCTLGEGEVFGEAGLFVNVKRTATVRSSEAALLLRMKRLSFFNLLKSDSKLGIKLLFIIMYGLLYKLRLSNQDLALERRHEPHQSDIDRMIDELIPDDTTKLFADLKSQRTVPQ